MRGEPTIAGHGFSVSLPTAWEGRIYQRPTPTAAFTPENRAPPARQVAPETARPGRRSGWLGEQTRPVVHLATFALPADRGDYGSGAVETMGAGNMFIAIAGIRPGMPGHRAVRLHRAAAGHAEIGSTRTGCSAGFPGRRAVQSFFTEQSRPMCLYVVLGSASQRGRVDASRSTGPGPGHGGPPDDDDADRATGAHGRPPGRRRSGTSRRGFLGGAALVGAALAVNPWGYLVRPASAYETVCGTEPACADGYSVFCCTINGGSNTCPPNSFIGGWWKADNSSFCGGSARYYIDCNAFRERRLAVPLRRRHLRSAPGCLQPVPLRPVQPGRPGVEHRTGGLPDGVLHAAVATVRRHLHQFQRHRQPDGDPLGAVPRAAADRQSRRGRGVRRGHSIWAAGRSIPTSRRPRSRSRSIWTAAVSAGSPPAGRGPMSTPPTASPATTASTSRFRPPAGPTPSSCTPINVGGGGG